MAMAKAILAVAAVAVLAVQLAAAADHPVGDDGSWVAGTDYNTWAAKKKFVQGDTITFNYGSSHDVVEVTKAGYDSCSGAGSNAVKSYTDGKTAVKLATPGKHYFICSVTGHCSAGMKLEVTVAAATAGAAAPAPSKSKPRHQRSVAPAPAAAQAEAPEGSSTEVTTPTAAPAPKPSGAAAAGALGAKAVVGLAAGVALALAM